MIAEANFSGGALETAHLCLRPAARTDIDTLHALWTDPEVRRFLWDDVIIPRETAEEVVEASLASFAQHAFGMWVIECGAETAGFAGLRHAGEPPEVELLYGLYARYWRRGLAQEAARAVLDHAFRTLRLPRIIAGADSPNLRSLRTLERLGMIFEEERLVNGRPTRYYALNRP